MVVPQLMRLYGQYDIAEGFDKEQTGSAAASTRGRILETMWPRIGIGGSKCVHFNINCIH